MCNSDYNRTLRDRIINLYINDHNKWDQDTAFVVGRLINCMLSSQISGIELLSVIEDIRALIYHEYFAVTDDIIPEIERSKNNDDSQGIG